jgi:3-oxoacyl-[acyl-carrier-protein] synthase-3
MAFLDINNVSICGMSASAPCASEAVKAVYKWGWVDNFLNTTGIQARRKASNGVTTSDLCYAAAEKLIEELKWDKSEIDALVFVTQTPDYILPATSPILQSKLGLSNDCYTLDISLGCSGWVYALSVIAALMQNGTIRKGLLLAGDTILKMCSPEDKSTYPLFGDAGTATALVYDPSSIGLKFNLNSDGAGYETIIIRDGGYRNQPTTESFVPQSHGEGIERSNMNLELDGMNVFSFGISKAPKSVKGLIEKFGIDKESVDLFTFHQANMFMNESIRKKLKIESEKVPYCMDEFGNTSCASIPLTLVTRRREQLISKKLNHIACGFGVGLSWGSVYFETDNITVPELIEI